MEKPHLTVGEAARKFGVKQWRVRRIVDELDDQLPRAGQYRLIPSDLLPIVAERLEKRGWLPSHVVGVQS